MLVENIERENITGYENTLESPKVGDNACPVIALRQEGYWGYLI
ncbi:hypothetical protein [Peribacillus frigoritolerans]|nr:hypothetical protein [Peribacillus frigoritolerans]